MVGTVAVLPWLFIPLIKNALLKKLVVPYLKASKGIKKLTDVQAIPNLPLFNTLPNH